ncbi:hypothetical protein MLD38_025341 [Melastoma candidum]|uniref:Uncharacterized protein n=1 Tax=Melastoma candidum TaxID=119954 RepID=A0ACB9NUS3_9MYRT|nr:hypothetical protein MLD38_025341 [Melastoma candidum]
MENHHDHVPDNQRVYFVPLRWWKDAEDGVCGGDVAGGVSREPAAVYVAAAAAASSPSSYLGPMRLINNMFSPDLAFNLRRGEAEEGGGSGEVGVSGRDFAMVSGEMWVQALKWHSDSKAALKESKSFSAAEDDMSDVYPLQLRLAIPKETNTLSVKICKKDNTGELFKRACRIFGVDTEPLRIWDFSGHIKQYFLNGSNGFIKDYQKQSEMEIVLELQIYGLSDSPKCIGGKKEEKGFPYCNGFSRCSEAGSLGLTGLQNLGNTCFMNSALQCLVHTPKLVDYFLGDYANEINHRNPLGMDGEIALAFGDLLRKLWAPGATPVAPRTFKAKLARFAPQFNGYNQHDSQELLAFLLDGLHEDLNRVKCKIYVEAKDFDGRPDEEVADEYWHYHLARNNSIIVDVCQGQYKSTLVCPVCKKVSVTFDPFMYLSLPLPSTSIRTMTVTVINTDGSAKLSPYTVSVPKFGKCEDLVRALSVACSLGSDETLLVAEIYNSRIIRYLEDPADSLTLIRDQDQLVAYRLARQADNVPLVVFMHQKLEKQYVHDSSTSDWKAFGIPLVARLDVLGSGVPISGADICSIFTRLLHPFHKSSQANLGDVNETEDTVVEDASTTEDAATSASGEPLSNSPDVTDVMSPSDPELQFYLTDEKGLSKKSKIEINEPVPPPRNSHLYVAVCWPESQIKECDVDLLCSLPEIFKSGLLEKRAQETVSLYKCLEAFLTEEPLGPEDMWYCPSCKEHRQASKKLDLWRLPEILVIHLKRFSYSRFMKNKLETYVDFPISDLDLSAYISHTNAELSSKYMLYAVSNHYGSMGGGHYTAFVHQGGDQWYDFDDSHVYPISLNKIKTSAAYVLFYRRVVEP